MRHLASAGPPSLAALLRRQTVPVTCVVGSPFLPWALDVAEGLGIPAAVLWVQSCAVFSPTTLPHRLAAFPLSTPTPRLPPRPPAALRRRRPSFLHPSNPYKLLADTILASFGNLGKARWLLANSFNELEHDAIAASPPSALTRRPAHRPLPRGPLNARRRLHVVARRAGKAVCRVRLGLPVIAFPQWGDQVTNAKFLVDVYGVGVRLPAPVEREAVRRCVEAVVGAGPEAEGMRARAAKWKEAAAAAVAEGAVVDRNIQNFATSYAVYSSILVL
ncbi:Limonoid UDP-glucosyltransferase [Ananas comosus]|uniref:Limonoid UDP-glucosyltransferase n=1 Tax=Ananas comosus TaxID=4615 RepID=A0A199VH16_ANACO|nr:Limonoid UDP-glucosyltransferase [Ananas comosus]